MTAIEMLQHSGFRRAGSPKSGFRFVGAPPREVPRLRSLRIPPAWTDVAVNRNPRAKLLANPNITYIESAHGGHCAFLAEPNGYDGRWAEKTLVEFLKNH